MSGWLIPREDLTDEQLRVVEFSYKENRVVSGGPGSGKTIVMLHRAKYLSDISNNGKLSFHIFVFTRSLKDYIKSSLDYLGLPEDSVSTFDSWCYHFHSDNIGKKMPKTTYNKTDYEQIRHNVYEYLINNDEHQKKFNFVMVDEGQDLESTSLKILKLISHHVTIFFDNKQQIYSHGSNEKQIMSCMNANHKNFSLLSVYRCSPYIVDLASQFICDPDEKNIFVRQTRVAQTEKETPLFYKAKDHEDEKQRMVKALKTRLSKGERIAILFPQKKQVFGYAKAFKEMGIDVEVPSRGKNQNFIRHDFSSERPKLMPYHSAKGLTFDTVFMPRLLDHAFFIDNDETLRRLLFVGISRSITWVYMSTVSGQNFKYIDIINKLSKAGSIRIEDYESADNKQIFFSDHNDDVEDDPFDGLL